MSKYPDEAPVFSYAFLAVVGTEIREGGIVGHYIDPPDFRNKFSDGLWSGGMLDSLKPLTVSAHAMLAIARGAK